MSAWVLVRPTVEGVGDVRISFVEFLRSFQGIFGELNGFDVVSICLIGFEALRRRDFAMDNTRASIMSFESNVVRERVFLNKNL